MARDRKRAKQRQRRAQRASTQRVAVEDRRASKPAGPPAPVEDEPTEDTPADAELAEAALGRRGEETTGLERVEELERVGEADEEEEEELDPEFEPEASDEQPPARPREGREAAGLGGESTRTGGNRLFNFLRASWAELQRVQWPDRRQVTQATGVVLGFVVIAGAYLGLMDAIFSRLVDAIL
jgi:preprotein translocase SecE subunit